MSGAGNYCRTDSAVPQSAAGAGPRSSTGLGEWRVGGGGIPLGGGGGGGPGPESTYARVSANMRECALCRENATAGGGFWGAPGMHEYARVCAGMREYARVYMREYVRVCADTREYATVSAQVCASMRECALWQENATAGGGYIILHIYIYICIYIYTYIHIYHALTFL